MGKFVALTKEILWLFFSSQKFIARKFKNRKRVELWKAMKKVFLFAKKPHKRAIMYSLI
jgi:hypothetical protein